MAQFEASPFARDLTEHMCKWRKRVDGLSNPMLSSWPDGIYPDYRTLAQAVVIEDEVRLDDYRNELTSSQIFALNLFLPFRDGAREALTETLLPVIGERMGVMRVSFGWIPRGALLGELVGDRPVNDKERATAVDVVLWGTLTGGAKAVVLLEVKLGEGGFSKCSGPVSLSNRRPDVCASSKRFFSEPEACYLRRPVHKMRDTRYWSIFAAANGSVRAAFPGASLTGPCPFAGQAQQPMRNLAIARGLELEDAVQRAWFGLCAHDDNPDIAAHWSEWRLMLPDPKDAPVLAASALIEAGRRAGLHEWAHWMSKRYRLGDRLGNARYARAPSASLRAALSPRGLLAPLLTPHWVNDLRLDVLFRENDHVHVYCGLTRLVDVQLWQGIALVSADDAYTSQPCGGGLFRPWDPRDRGFAEALDRYFADVEVRPSYTDREGAVQAVWASVRDPWLPIDREAVIGYDGKTERRSARRFPVVAAAQSEVELLSGRGRPWAPISRRKTAAKLDQLAIDREGRLVLIELKHAAASAASIYYSPLQLLQYVHEWAVVFEDLREGLTTLCEARVMLQLSPAALPKLKGGIRPVIGFGEAHPTGVVRSRLESVLEVANRYLPAGVMPIEVWAMWSGKPLRLGPGPRST